MLKGEDDKTLLSKANDTGLSNHCPPSQENLNLALGIEQSSREKWSRVVLMRM